MNSSGGSNSKNEILIGRPVIAGESVRGSEVVRGVGVHQYQRADHSNLYTNVNHSSLPLPPHFPPQLSDVGGIGVANANAADKPDRSIPGMVKLQDWISIHRRNTSREDGKSMDVTSQKKYLEQLVRILHSLLFKIVSGCNSAIDEQENKDRSDDERILVHPNLISIANVVVWEQTEAVGSNKDCIEISADLVGYGDTTLFTQGSKDETRKKYMAMYALGRIAYAMCMMEDGLTLNSLSFQSGNETELSLSYIMNIHDKSNATIDEEDEIIGILRRNSHIHSPEEKDSGGLISVMLDAGVPFPLCRFVADLLDNEHGSVFRSEYSFSSFRDVMSDLNQMISHPNEFLYGVSPDRGRIVGERLYRREGAMEAFFDAVGHATGTIINDPLYDGLTSLMGKKTSVIMVSGHPGAGKSCLVRLGGKCLEKNGWRFLQCEFDRVGKLHEIP